MGKKISKNVRLHRNKGSKDQKASQQEQWKPAEEDPMHQIATALYRIEEQLKSANDDESPQKKHDRFWEKLEVGGLWAAAVVGIVAVIFATIDADKQRQLIDVQLKLTSKSNEASAKAADAAQSSAQTAKDTLTIAQRAFVFALTVEVKPLGDMVRINPIWTNSGSTPTREMKNYVSWKYFPTGTLTNDFEFPDLDTDGNPTARPILTNLFIGPKGTIGGQSVNVPEANIQAVASGKGRILIWGWTKYRDVFDSNKMHISEFSTELIVLAASPSLDVQGQAQVQYTYAFQFYPGHNCADEECQDQSK